MASGSDSVNSLEDVVFRLQAYCRENNWAGYEPYDALNSRLLAALPLMKFRIPRLVATQTLKRSPINFRRPLLIGKTQNPKALALFLAGFLKLAKAGVDGQIEQAAHMIDRLIALRSQGTRYWCWGYSFPWQTRTVLVPRWSPNLVCTAFSGAALLDAYEWRPDPRCLEMATSAAEYICDELYWENGNAAGFGYPLPFVRNQVHNANFLAADLLCRIYKHTGNEKFLTPALRATRYSVAQQHEDGGWDYGQASTQRWIDNFHTGFNLSALQSIGRSLGSAEFDTAVSRGLDFYRRYFFLADGSVRYYHNQTYPLDSHCVAQSVITLLDLKHLDPENVTLAQSVFQWAVNHLWDKEGFFYYRKLRSCTIRTSYIRWTQAWMLLAASMLLAETRHQMTEDTASRAVSMEA